ncbi:hypothetical protein [Nostoc sp. UHCC 0251]|nr:hypothetical protein [Nostoc sp. UHCC 0251]MEA5624663.1 hypothetical protein [Nostoc sp. UHCC 0251]
MFIFSLYCSLKTWLQWRSQKAQASPIAAPASSVPLLQPPSTAYDRSLG